MQEQKIMFLVYIQHPTQEKHKVVGHFDGVSAGHAINAARKMHPEIFAKYEGKLGGEVFAEAQG